MPISRKEVVAARLILTLTNPWGHAAMDPYRSMGDWELVRIVPRMNSFE